MNPNGATLLPKLRVEFAEFLNELSLERLWILSSSTCVGLRYGFHMFSLEVFLGSMNSSPSPHYGTALCLTVVLQRIYLLEPAYAHRTA
jgi:hypothetical protein